MNPRYSIDDVLGDSPIIRALNEHVPSSDHVFTQGVAPQVITSGEHIGNTTVTDGYLRSSNYVLGSTGWKLTKDSGEFNFAVEVDSLHIPDNVTANSFHVQEDGDTWWGTTQTNFDSNNDSAVAYILKTGVAKFQNVRVVGGVVGGFNVATDSLYAGTIKTAATVEAGSTGVIMDTAGLRGYDFVLGQTFNLPTDGSAPSFSSGVINETVFEIDTAGVMRTSSTVGDGTANSAGILINSAGIFATEANQLISNANIKILVNGTGEFNANIRGGQTAYNTGTGYFLGLSASQYKFSIGNPAGNFLTWDGSFLKMKGSFDVGASGVINNAVYTVATLPQPPTVVGFNMPSAFE